MRAKTIFHTSFFDGYIYTQRQKISTTYRFLLKQFSNYREEILFKMIFFCINIQMKIKKNTCDVSILLQNHAFSRLIRVSPYHAVIFKK